MLSGTLWTVSMRWSIKFLGLISTIVVARMLLPSDYAVIAMAMLVVGLIESVLDFSAETAILLKAEIDDNFINSAWSLRAVQGAGTGLVLLLLSPLAGRYFGDARVVEVLWLLAFCVTLGGTGNIGLVLARRKLNFSLDFKVALIAKSLQVLLTIISAYLLRDFRALVIGVVSGYIIGWLLSYILHDYRPRWNTTAFREVWRMTRWLMLSNVARFMLRKSDELAAGRIGTSSQFGLYNLGADLGLLPTGEISPAIVKAFLPALSSIQNDVERVRNGVLKVLAILNTITLPVAFGFAAISLPVTHLLLGEHWLDAAPIVALFSIAGAMQAAAQPLSTLLVLRGFARFQVRVFWCEFVIFAATSLVLVPLVHLKGLVIARIAGAIVSVFLFAYESQKKCGLPMRAAAAMVWRPLCASVLMYVVVSHTLTRFDSVVTGLISGIVAGVVTYVLLMLGSWHLFGKPQGLEHEAVAMVNARLARAS